MIDKLTIPMIVGVIIVLICGLFYSTIKSQEAFEERVSSEYVKCLAAKETIYTCKAYIQSLKAEKAADMASAASGMALGFSAATMGIRR